MAKRTSLLMRVSSKTSTSTLFGGYAVWKCVECAYTQVKFQMLRASWIFMDLFWLNSSFNLDLKTFTFTFLSFKASVKHQGTTLWDTKSFQVLWRIQIPNAAPKSCNMHWICIIILSNSFQFSIAQPRSAGREKDCTLNRECAPERTPWYTSVCHGMVALFLLKLWLTRRCYCVETMWWSTLSPLWMTNKLLKLNNFFLRKDCVSWRITSHWKSALVSPG